MSDATIYFLRHDGRFEWRESTTEEAAGDVAYWLSKLDTAKISEVLVVSKAEKRDWHAILETKRAESVKDWEQRFEKRELDEYERLKKKFEPGSLKKQR